MKLTVQCKEDFESYLESATNVTSMYSFRSLPESCQNALIIDFFDSVGIFISTEYTCLYIGKIFNCMVKKDRHSHEVGNYKDRSKAKNEGIKHANKLYNEIQHRTKRNPTKKR